MATPQELSDRYLEISELSLRQAQEELAVRKDYSQASDKVWRAVAEALKAGAVLRDWNHKSHPLLRDIATQLYLEFGRRQVIELFGSLENAHANYYEHRFDGDEVQLHLDWGRELVAELANIRNAPQRRFVPANREQERRLERLTRYDPNTAADAFLEIDGLPPVEPAG